MKERIQKILANAGLDSRRNIEQMVLQGRVEVNGEVLRELPILVDPQKDKIQVDGEPIKLKHTKAARKVYVLMNKPKGVYCTNVSQGEQKRAIDLLPENFPYRVYPVGRLDADSRGLLLLTNDGDLTLKLTHPRYGIAKTYVAEVEGYAQAEMVEALNRGVWLADKEGHGFKAGSSRVTIVNRGRLRSTLEIVLREGRNRQVRRMLAELGHKVIRLTRIKMGKLNLEGVGPGHWRFLTALEVKDLLRQVDRAAHPKEAAPTTESAPAEQRMTAEGKPSAVQPRGMKHTATKPPAATPIGKPPAVTPTGKPRAAMSTDKPRAPRPTSKPRADTSTGKPRWLQAHGSARPQASSKRRPAGR